MSYLDVISIWQLDYDAIWEHVKDASTSILPGFCCASWGFTLQDQEALFADVIFANHN